MLFTVKKITDTLIDETLEKARQSSRRRAMYCFSAAHETIQHMINACIKGTYMQPHKHEDPDKTEIISILKGRMAVFTFDDDGKISTYLILEENGPNKALEIPSRTWHNMLVLGDEAVVHEIVTGPFDAYTHKKFASFSPPENDIENAQKYLKILEEYILNY